MTNHFGTNIMFRGRMKGKGRGKSYRFIGSTRKDMPYVTFFNKHKRWERKNEKILMDRVTRVLNHEPIHQILWWLKEDPNTNYDVIKYRFLKRLPKGIKKELRLVV